MKTWWSYEEYSYQNKVQRIKSKIDSPILKLEANVWWESKENDSTVMRNLVQEEHKVKSTHEIMQI